MTIAGLQKMTLLDYPGRVACTVFLQGCNFRCPFCHNSGLLTGETQEEIPMEAFLTFLSRRQGLLDAVCISGGEPTLSPELPELVSRVKQMGYLVKLDTNGSRPDVLKALAAENLLDYVAMDVKNSPARYAETIGAEIAPMEAVEESLRFLLDGGVPDYELRTTVAEELHDEASIQDMGVWLEQLGEGKKVKKMFIQPFQDRESVFMRGLHTPGTEQTARFATLLQPYVEQVGVRG